ncbi:unannotated protein [freshwater metagenome]|uniref:Unannotated protein n=1 Tax=freshwater metagenome TaxID=449393 RepID=A0A6J6X9R3_9ZZZZ
MVALFQNRFGAFDVVEVRVDNRGNGSRRVNAQFVQSRAHLFNGLARVDGDDASGSLNKGLVREAVPDERPDARPDRLEVLFDDVVLSSVFVVRAGPTRQRHGVLWI